ncbi:MAG: hypothetical protein ORN98_08940 [Alphaproteobacteria bacterium]|nr:hypothetical protein [Alphaproteobacteria bacterium]
MTTSKKPTGKDQILPSHVSTENSDEKSQALVSSQNATEIQENLLRFLLTGARRISVVKSWSGPLPSPEILKEYKELHPDSVKTIFDEFAKERNHQRLMDKLGIGAAFIIAIMGMGATVYLAMNGHEFAASVMGGGTLVVMVTAFLRRDRLKISQKPSDNSPNPTES